MKRIINGVTYNTDTATKIARSDYKVDAGNMLAVLYQTRGGSFFLHEQVATEYFDEDLGEPAERVKDACKPMTRDQAQEWVLSGEIELLADVFGEPPEATAPIADREATVYIRVPAALKDKIDAAARERELSGNSWGIRCLEACLGDTSGAKVLDINFASLIEDELYPIWDAARSVEVYPDGYSKERLLQIVGFIEGKISDALASLGIDEDKQLTELSYRYAEDAQGDRHHESHLWEPYADEQS